MARLDSRRRPRNIAASGCADDRGIMPKGSAGMARLALAAAILITTVGLAVAQPATTPSFPPGSQMPTNNPQAEANVRAAKNYNQVMRGNPAFRRKREQIECGPITDPQLRQQCIASFEAYR
jgi:hypothetical protein